MDRAPATAAVCGRLRPVLGLILVLIVIHPVSAHGQAPAQNSLFSAVPSTGLISPSPSTRTDIFGPSSLPPTHPAPTHNAAPPTTASIPPIPAGQVALALSARFGKDAQPIGGGLTWRVYTAKADTSGNFKLVKEDKSPTPTLVLPAGAYIVHVGFGLATAVKPVELRGSSVHEEFDLPAAACALKARLETFASLPDRFRLTSIRAAI
jgi:hypothetical protein